MGLPEHLFEAHASPGGAAILKQFECSVCLDIVRDPVITTECAHIFCRDCFGTMDTCPLCRQDTDMHPLKDTNSGRALWRVLCCLKMRCPKSDDWQNHPCAWVGEYADLEKHMAESCVQQHPLCPQCRAQESVIAAFKEEMEAKFAAVTAKLDHLGACIMHHAEVTRHTSASMMHTTQQVAMPIFHRLDLMASKLDVVDTMVNVALERTSAAVVQVAEQLATKTARKYKFCIENGNSNDLTRGQHDITLGHIELGTSPNNLNLKVDLTIDKDNDFDVYLYLSTEQGTPQNNTTQHIMRLSRHSRHHRVQVRETSRR
mmetsp:Transcript_25197/g.62396  ORF Transcript_25197/g.62396 Transcript_25197/m.62396 type:complete len:316 (-) Transcript_25197:996-1943(-)